MRLYLSSRRMNAPFPLHPSQYLRSGLASSTTAPQMWQMIRWPTPQSLLRARTHGGSLSIFRNLANIYAPGTKSLYRTTGVSTQR